MYKLWLLLTTMFSFRAARSFSVLRHHTSAQLLPAKASFRLFSVSGEAGTSIVDICQKKIQDALQADSVKVTGAYDDPNGSHISIEVVSSMFAGKRAVQRQQLVYKAIWEELQGPVHAVDAMVCKTPDE
ncbi:hypothetical protein FisN_1Hh083 [Fistulifera solaris]|uniref:BolA protein n=1 Tax=Fistulifera solaris TaxID=1519565 RepID=A0A1Z5JEF9_FISSO|nr:hypothetical protein FisN_1Hh083 [Fistulifera solaris]|eukprot:GAX12158.1 hypothetical protein FisN_1Hh083 [Fistulifera solaris]